MKIKTILLCSMVAVSAISSNAQNLILGNSANDTVKASFFGQRNNSTNAVNGINANIGNLKWGAGLIPLEYVTADELATELSGYASAATLTAHINDTTGAHAASAVSFDDESQPFSAANVQDAISDVANAAYSAFNNGVQDGDAAGGDLAGTYPNPTLAAAGTAGTYTKVTTDSKGRVTSGSAQTAADIPNLPAEKITSGVFSVGHFGVDVHAARYYQKIVDGVASVNVDSSVYLLNAGSSNVFETLPDVSLLVDGSNYSIPLTFFRIDDTANTCTLFNEDGFIISARDGGAYDTYELEHNESVTLIPYGSDFYAIANTFNLTQLQALIAAKVANNDGTATNLNLYGTTQTHGPTILAFATVQGQLNAEDGARFTGDAFFGNAAFDYLNATNATFYSDSLFLAPLRSSSHLDLIPAEGNRIALAATNVMFGTNQEMCVHVLPSVVGSSANAYLMAYTNSDGITLHANGFTATQIVEANQSVKTKALFLGSALIDSDTDLDPTGASTIYFVDASASNITITLPPADLVGGVNMKNPIYNFIRIDTQTANAVTIDVDFGTIKGTISIQLPVNSSEILVATAEGWYSAADAIGYGSSHQIMAMSSGGARVFKTLQVDDFLEVTHTESTITVSSRYHKTGLGSPEGVLTAVRGVTYSRLDGGAGTTFYVKESGTGNTGWVAK